MYMEATFIKPVEQKVILIVGRSYLQNNLLASYIKKNTGFITRFVEVESIFTLRLDLELNPQLLLFDCDEINTSSLKKIIDSLNTTCPQSKIALFNVKQNGTEEETVALPVIKGIFYRDTTESKLVDGIKAIIEGELWLSRRLISKFYTNKKSPQKNNNKDLGLTEREVQIIKLISEGEQNKEIAKRLCLSNHTIKSHIYHIYKKLNVSNRTQAANWAQQHLTFNT